MFRYLLFRRDPAPLRHERHLRDSKFVTAQLTTPLIPSSEPVDDSPRARSLGLALSVIAASAVLLGTLQLGVALAAAYVLWPVLLFTAAFWIWTAAGLAVWWIRSGDRIGPLLLGGGAAVLLGGLGNVGIPSLSVVGAVFTTAVIAVTVNLVLAYPDGRVRGELTVTAVVLAYIVAVGLQLARVAIPGELVQPFILVTLIQRWLGLAVLTLIVLLLVRRLARAPLDTLRARIPVSLGSVFVVILVPLMSTLLNPLDVPPSSIGTIQLALTCVIPVLFLVGLLGERGSGWRR